MSSHCLAARLAARPQPDQAAFLRALTPPQHAALRWAWEAWARPEQLPPVSDWSTWLILGGRGSGKTRAGAEWVRAQAETGTARRIALIGETADQARDVMVLGDSGLMAITPRAERPVFSTSRRRLIWPNGTEAHLFSASDPESLRGPQFDAAWCDELAKWRRAQAAWDQLQFGLRLGHHPRAVVTTTPRANPTLIGLIGSDGTATTRMPTRANAANLAPSFLKQIEAQYAGRTLGRQELLGELIEDVPGALWSRAMIEAAQTTDAPAFDRIVVAVDPPVTARAGSDACGIVVAGLTKGDTPTATVLADWSVQGVSPQAWAARAVAAYHVHGADRLVAEVNQGGDMVEAIIRQIDEAIAYKPVRASRGKAVRAEPVAALYEQGRVMHLAHDKHPLTNLEDQMCSFGAGLTGDTKSPDRVDALVWAITELLLAKHPEPRVRFL